MSLFGAKKTSTFQKAAERARKMTQDPFGSPSINESASSGIESQRTIARDLQDLDGTATTSEIAREGENDFLGRPVVLPREVYNEAARAHNQELRDMGRQSQEIPTEHGGSSIDDEGNLVYKPPRVYTIPNSADSTRTRYRSRSVDSQESSRLSSPPPTTSYGGSQISFPEVTPRQSTRYEGSIVGFPPSALPQDPFSVPRSSAGIIAHRYIQSEENASQYAQKGVKEEGVDETLKGYTPILRKFEVSDGSDSEDEAMMEVE